ncbi:MAG: hypothetical protein WC565_03500 [Parcubacteria group bacterium]
MTEPLWHGTNEQAGKQILADGVLRPVHGGKYKKRSVATPLPGRVYVTKDPMYAGVYAIGGVWWGTDHTNPEGSGFIFRVKPSSQADFVIDEDQLGELAVSGKVPWLSKLGQSLGGTYRQKWDGTLWQAAQDGTYDAWITLGKALHRKLSPAQMSDLLPFATQFAIDGEVSIVEAWRIPYSRVKDIHDAESLFKQAVRVDVDTRGNPTMKRNPVTEDVRSEAWGLKPGDKFIVTKGSTKLGVGIRNYGTVKDVWQSKRDLDDKYYRVMVRLSFVWPVKSAKSGELVLYATHPNRLSDSEPSLMNSRGDKIHIRKQAKSNPVGKKSPKKSSSLLALADRFIAKTPRSNPVDGLDEEARFDQFIFDLKSSGKATSDWGESEWYEAAIRFGFDPDDASMALDQVAAWGIDD